MAWHGHAHRADEGDCAVAALSKCDGKVVLARYVGQYSFQFPPLHIVFFIY